MSAAVEAIEAQCRISAETDQAVPVKTTPQAEECGFQFGPMFGSASEYLADRTAREIISSYLKKPVEELNTNDSLAKAGLGNVQEMMEVFARILLEFAITIPESLEMKDKQITKRLKSIVSAESANAHTVDDLIALSRMIVTRTLRKITAGG